MIKAAVLYHSKTGHTKEMAQVIVDGINSVEGTEARAFSIDQLDLDWIKESRCVIFGCPIYMASISGEAKQFLGGPALTCGLPGKLGGAFATADYIHGGGELGIRTILDHMMVMGMLTFSGGGMYGKPVIHLGPVAISGHLEESRDTFLIYGQRMAAMTKTLFS